MFITHGVVASSYIPKLFKGGGVDVIILTRHVWEGGKHIEQKTVKFSTKSFKLPNTVRKLVSKNAASISGKVWKEEMLIP